MPFPKDVILPQENPQLKKKVHLDLTIFLLLTKSFLSLNESQRRHRDLEKRKINYSLGKNFDKNTPFIPNFIRFTLNL